MHNEVCRRLPCICMEMYVLLLLQIFSIFLSPYRQQIVKCKFNFLRDICIDIVLSRFLHKYYNIIELRNISRMMLLINIMLCCVM